jgi:hypothetical protein
MRAEKTARSRIQISISQLARRPEKSLRINL